jgi:pimeloyl-ACP methyl ester carboxylesterase
VATFVLVHGAWHSAWCWRRVAGLLTRSGHEVFAPTLTGLGERSHLLTSAIDLDTHIVDVVNEMKWQQLNDVVLVGHSYGAMVIAGVAEKMERSISSFVVVDGFLPETGQAVIDLQPQATQDSLRSAQASGATTIPPRSAAFFHVNEKDRAFVDAQCTPQPLKCFLQKLTLTRARERVANKVYIRATGYPSEPFDLAMATARVKGWRVHELACGHDVMLDQPERLAEILQGR